MARRNRKKQSNRSVSAKPAAPAQQAQIQQIGARQEFSGPIPPPVIMEQYEKLLPGAADRLIAMAEGEAVHRRGAELRVLESEISDRAAGRTEARVGQICGLMIGLAAITCGTYAAVNGAQLFGGVISTGGVATLVGIFVWGRTRRPEQRAEK